MKEPAAAGLTCAASVSASCCASSCERTSADSGVSSSFTIPKGSTSGGASWVMSWQRLCVRSMPARFRTTSAALLSSMICMSLESASGPIAVADDMVAHAPRLGLLLLTGAPHWRPYAPCQRPATKRNRMTGGMMRPGADWVAMGASSPLLGTGDSTKNLGTRKNLSL